MKIEIKYSYLYFQISLTINTIHTRITYNTNIMHQYNKINCIVRYEYIGFFYEYTNTNTNNTNNYYYYK